MKKTFYASSLAEWRAWLEANHASERDVWLLFSKKHTGQPCIEYEDAVQEALCYGWIDSLIQRIDEDTYGRKFSVRTNDQKWSEVNIRRVRKLASEGRMKPAGMAVVTFPLDEAAAPPPAPKTPPALAGDLLDILKANPPAYQNYLNLPPSHQRRYAGWIMDAKTEATRRKRLEEAIRRLEQNLRLEGK
ncbi:MAG TPA: YdeI/OmpD-associated family protein [Anaerolineaceae bacterium]